MKLIHYANKRLAEFKPVEKQDIHHKPDGLWVSVEGPDDWLSWCKAEQFRLWYLQFPHEIKLRPDAKILRITNAEELDIFSGEFSRCNGAAVNWIEVAEQYDGIIIAPYIWERRLASKLFWYYSWDCASGCIWNSVISEVVELPEINVVSLQATDYEESVNA